MRSILFDTETTGLNPIGGDRVVEIAALELWNDLPTGVHFHRLIDPERDIPEEATRIHGIARETLIGKPLFAHVAEEFLEFVGDGKLVAHNAPFDFAFLDAELSRIGRGALDRARMICTLELAKQRFPGMPNNLDALCRRFGIDLSERTTHNALLDCKLLAQVYIELTGGRQRGLLLAADGQSTSHFTYTRSETRAPALIVPTTEQVIAHAAFVAKLKDPVWNKP